MLEGSGGGDSTLGNNGSVWCFVDDDAGGDEDEDAWVDRTGESESCR